MGIISWATIDDPLSLPAGIVGGLLIGLSTYIYMLRSGGW
jgi:hypothetical protein